jgi:hypothetical protein
VSLASLQVLLESPPGAEGKRRACTSTRTADWQNRSEPLRKLLIDAPGLCAVPNVRDRDDQRAIEVADDGLADRLALPNADASWTPRSAVRQVAHDRSRRFHLFYSSRGTRSILRRCARSAPRLRSQDISPDVPDSVSPTKHGR